MNRELLDDAIDRVAREMTRVAPAPALSHRVRTQIEERSEGRPLKIVLVAITAAAMLVAAVMLWRVPSHQVSGPVTQPLASRALTTYTPHAASVTTAPLRPTPAAMRSRVANTGVAASAIVVPLTIEAIAVDTLSEVEPLHVGDIQIADITIGENKESR
jgi:hypothetical protein